MKVAILTMFNGLSRTYSLVNVVAEHIKMLLDNNIEVKLLVCEDCNENESHGIFLDKRIQWIRVNNRLRGEQIHWRDYNSPDIPIHDSLLEEANAIEKDFIKYLKDVDICMMHDIHYQGWHMVHNIAIRNAQKSLPNVRFIAMTHSIPDTSQVGKELQWPHSARYSSMPNTIYAYPTESGLDALSKQYNVNINKCAVISNSLNLLENMSAEVNDLHSKIDLLSSDILIVYPARLTQGKRFEKVAMMGGAIKSTTNKSVKIIFCEFPSMDINPTEYKKIITSSGVDFGLDEKDIVFTSDYGYESGFKRSNILELFTLSNLFICPSLSESFCLTALESASRGNFLVLNNAVPALHELGGILDSYFMKWDARNFFNMTKEIYHPSEKDYYEYHAQCIVDIMENNPVLKSKTLVRQRYSPQYIFESQLKPLLNGL